MQITVCDVCQSHPTTAYEITSEGRKAQADLCKEHAKPLEDLLRSSKATLKAQKSAPRRTATKSAPKGGRRKVWTPEEIEALKEE